MSITAETVQAHANDPAVLCCRTEKGVVIGPDHLEDPGIFEDLVDSGLLEISDEVLTLSQVMGATMKETADSLTPLTPALVEGFAAAEKAALISPADADPGRYHQRLRCGFVFGPGAAV